MPPKNAHNPRQKALKRWRDKVTQQEKRCFVQIQLEQHYYQQFKQLAAEYERDLLQQQPHINRQCCKRLARTKVVVDGITRSLQPFIRLKQDNQQLKETLDDTIPDYLRHDLTDETNSLPRTIQQLPDDPLQLKIKLAASEKQRLDLLKQLAQQQATLQQAEYWLERYKALNRVLTEKNQAVGEKMSVHTDDD